MGAHRDGHARFLVKLLSSAALLGAGALGGAAVTARPTPVAAPAAAPALKPRVEVRTIVKHRTVHVYRRPKPHPARPAPAAPAAQAPAAAPAVTVAPAAPVRVVRPVAPVTQRPLETRTSGAPGRGEREDGDEHESERGDD